MDKKHFKLWRRPISGTHLYQYRGESRLAAGAVFCPSRCSALCSLTLCILVLSREHCHGVLLFFLSLMTGIMASGPITSWQIDGETVETVADFILGGSKITADGDYSHEIRRRLLLGRKVMTNLDSILKSRHITFSTKVCLVKAMVFQWSCMDVRVGL